MRNFPPGTTTWPAGQSVAGAASAGADPLEVSLAGGADAAAVEVVTALTIVGRASFFAATTDAPAMRRAPSAAAPKMMVRDPPAGDVETAAVLGGAPVVDAPLLGAECAWERGALDGDTDGMDARRS